MKILHDGSEEAAILRGPTPLPTLVRMIRQDWRRPYFGAVPYIDALSELNSLDDIFYCDDGRTLATYFLANAQTWRGPVAASVKAELRRQLGVK